MLKSETMMNEKKDKNNEEKIKMTLCVCINRYMKDYTNILREIL